MKVEIQIQHAYSDSKPNETRPVMVISDTPIHDGAYPKLQIELEGKKIVLNIRDLKAAIEAIEHVNNA
jgi:hypothetical protein